MNQGLHQPELPGEALPPSTPPPEPPRLVNPSLSGSLAADHEALQNDLFQAQELAADFQRQLAGKSNEYAQLKQILEKTRQDLEHLQGGIVELRAERHRLANEAMRATAFEAKLMKVTGERDRLRIDLEFVRQALAKKGEEVAAQLHERDRRIAELVVEMVGLRQALEAARKDGQASSTAHADDAHVPRPIAVEPRPSVAPLNEADAQNVEIVRTPRLTPRRGT